MIEKNEEFLIMYVRVYNNRLIKVYSGEDLKSSEMISKLKGRGLAGFTIRDRDGDIQFYDREVVSSSELQMIIRNLKTVTVAIKMSDDEVIDYFYTIAKLQLIEHNRDSFRENELYEWMNAVIDSGIIKSSIWQNVKDNVYFRLSESGFLLKD